MFGSIVPEKGELKVREFADYRAAYCGLCKALSRRYGFVARNTLSYDCAFFALLLHALCHDALKTEKCRCLAGPIKPHMVAMGCDAFDAAADVNVLLAYFKAKDDVQDEHRFLSWLIQGALTPARRATQRKNEALTQAVSGDIKHLFKLEKQQCGDLDEASEPFAQILAVCFAESALQLNENIRAALRKIGYNLGKWIYLLDAVEDVGADAKKQRYNVLLCHGNDVAQAKAAAGFDMRCALNQAVETYELLPLRHSQPVLDNIFKLGMWQRTERALSGEGAKNKHESL